MPRVYVSIGSNIDREKSIRDAVRALQELYGALLLSKVYESAAQGFSGDNFYNLVAAFDTGESVEQVKKNLAHIETRCGRKRETNRFSARTLDLDLLLYDNVIRHDDHVDLPHPDIGQYAFVLKPLAEIAPNWRHPETGLSSAQMWQRFDTGEQKIWNVDFEFKA